MAAAAEETVREGVALDVDAGISHFPDLFHVIAYGVCPMIFG